MKIESKIGQSTYPESTIYNYISDFRNFRDIIPQDKVSDWSAEEDKCSFSVSPVGKMGMRITEKEASKLIKIGSDPAISQYNFTMWIQIKQLQEGDSRIRITIQPEVNKMLLPMIKGPLKQFVDSLIEKIETFKFD